MVRSGCNVRLYIMYTHKTDLPVFYATLEDEIKRYYYFDILYDSRIMVEQQTVTGVACTIYIMSSTVTVFFLIVFTLISDISTITLV